MEPTRVNIKQLFGQDIQYTIPLFQRHYVWKEDSQWEPLWEDIEQKAKRRLGVKERGVFLHFTGAIVIQQKDTNVDEVNSYEIIDGQQRMTTFQVVLCAIRDVCQEQGWDGISGEAKKYILNTGMHAEGEGKYKLILTQFDQPAFKSFVDPESRTEDSESDVVKDAYDYFYNKTQVFIDCNKEKALALFASISEDFGFVQIRIEREDEPEMIFESLNARGKALSHFDLLRNNLFLTTKKSQGEDRDDLYQKHWAHFEKSFWDTSVKVGKEKIPLAELFLRHFLMTKLATEDVSPLFQTYRREYRKSLGQQPRIKHEFSELHRYSNHYKALANNKDTSPVGHAAEVYHILNLTSLRPIFLYLLAEVKMPIAVQTHVFNALESYVIRRVVCTKSGHKHFNIFFSSVIKHLKNAANPVHELISLLQKESVESNLWPDDLLVKDHLEGLWVSTSNRLTIRYVLYRMELFERKRNRFTEPDDLPFIPSLTLEHVLPEGWKDRWLLPHKDGKVKYEEMFSKRHKTENVYWWNLPAPDGLVNQDYVDAFDTARQRQDWLQSIGNLTLLTHRLNASVSNAPFHEKKNSVQKHSTLLLNNRIFREDDWDVPQIKKRTEYLRKMFSEIWRDAQWFVENIPKE